MAKIPWGNHKCPVSKHAFSKPWPLSLKGPSYAVSVSYLPFSREYRCKRTSFIFALFCSISWHGSKREISLHCVRINGPFLQRLVLKLAIREMLFSSGPQVVQPTFVFSFCDEIYVLEGYEKSFAPSTLTLHIPAGLFYIS